MKIHPRVVVRIGILVTLALSLASCSGARKKRDSGQEQVGLSGAPSSDGKATPADKTIFIAPLTDAYGYATAGMLLRLSEDKLRVDTVYSTGTSALMSALYLSSKSRARYEWALQRVDFESVFEEVQGIRKLFRMGSSVDRRLRKLCDETFHELRLESLGPTQLYILVDGQWISEGRLADVVYATISKSSVITISELADIETRESGRLLLSSISDLQDPPEVKAKFNGEVAFLRLQWNSFAPPTYHEKTNLIFAGKESTESLLPDLKGWPRTK